MAVTGSSRMLMAILATGDEGMPSPLNYGEITQLKITGELELTGAAKLILAGLLTNEAEALNLGTAAVTTHALGPGDVLIGADLEVDGVAYFDAVINQYSNLNILTDNSGFVFGAAGNRSAFYKNEGTDQLLFALGSAVGRQIVVGDWAFRNSDYDHVTPTDPTQFVHSVLDPATDNGEYLGFSYLGLEAGTMETDRAKFDLTLRAVSALPAAVTNQDGGDVNLRPGARASGGGTMGGTRILDSDGSTLIAEFRNSQIGLYATTPASQHSSTGQTAGFTAGIGTSVLDDSTFTGGTGSTAYTIGDVVRALKLIGAMAS